jgi:hypothetical protein
MNYLDHISDIPNDMLPCEVSNKELWDIFINSFTIKRGFIPKIGWTEAEVVQWMDINIINEK